MAFNLFENNLWSFKLWKFSLFLSFCWFAYGSVMFGKAGCHFSNWIYLDLLGSVGFKAFLRLLNGLRLYFSKFVVKSDQRSERLKQQGPGEPGGDRQQNNSGVQHDRSASEPGPGFQRFDLAESMRFEEPYRFLTLGFPIKVQSFMKTPCIFLCIRSSDLFDG